MQNTTVIGARGRRGLPIKSMIALEQGTNGQTAVTVLYEEKRKRRVTKRWRSVDKFIRRLGNAQKTAASDFLARHEQSNKKKKNGGLRNLIKNFSRSQRKGRKQLKLKFI